MSIQDDASRILEYLADFLQDGDNPDERGHYSLTGHGVHEGVSLSPNRINMAAQLLENRGLVEIQYYAGTSPYAFGGISITAEGRAVVDQHRSQKDDVSKELVIVLFAANPDGTSMLALDQEVRISRRRSALQLSDLRFGSNRSGLYGQMIFFRH